jgi:hypothetical protein
MKAKRNNTIHFKLPRLKGFRWAENGPGFSPLLALLCQVREVCESSWLILDHASCYFTYRFSAGRSSLFTPLGLKYNFPNVPPELSSLGFLNLHKERRCLCANLYKNNSRAEGGKLNYLKIERLVYKSLNFWCDAFCPSLFWRRYEQLYNLY